MRKAHILITGGAGFIGSRLARFLHSEGCVVSVYDSFHPQAHVDNEAEQALLASSGVQVIRGDVRDAAALRAAIARTKPSVIYHLAAETGTGQSFDLPVRYVDVNVLGTANLIEAIRSSGPQVRRVILAGSRSVYGEGACINAAGQITVAVERNPMDMRRHDFAPKDRFGTNLTPIATNADCPPAPTSVYASSKLMQEYVLKQGFWGSGVQVGILRLQNVFGPGQSMDNPYTGVLSIFCRQILDGQVLNIFEDGQIIRDFVFVDDVVSAFAAMGAAEKMPSEILDIGSGKGASVLQVAQRLLKVLGRDPARVAITGEFRPGDIRHAVADISRAQALLGWQPKVDLDDGLVRLAEWSKPALQVMAHG
jgi:dTDP-L-rhamnose 4-epimerase